MLQYVTAEARRRGEWRERLEPAVRPSAHAHLPTPIRPRPIAQPPTHTHVADNHSATTDGAATAGLGAGMRGEGGRPIHSALQWSSRRGRVGGRWRRRRATDSAHC